MEVTNPVPCTLRVMIYHHPDSLSLKTQTCDETKAKADSTASAASDIENVLINLNLTSDLNWRKW